MRDQGEKCMLEVDLELIQYINLELRAEWVDISFHYVLAFFNQRVFNP